MRYIFPIAAVLILLVSPLSSQKKQNTKKKAAPKDSRRVISFESYFKQIKKSLPEIQINKLQVDKAQNSLRGAKGIGNISLESDLNYAKNTQYFSSDSSVSKNASGSAALSKIFSISGTRLSHGLEYNRSISSGLFTDGEETITHQPAIFFTLSQPLLYNSFGKLDRFAEGDARMKLEIERLKKIENDKAALRFFEKLYYQWVEYEKIIKEVDSNIVNAQKLEALVKRQKRAGLVDQDDVLKTRSTLIQYRVQKKQYTEALNQIKNKIALYVGIDKAQADEKLFRELFKNALEKRYAFVPFTKTNNNAILLLTLKNLQYIQDGAQNKSLPQLDLIARYKRKNNAETFSDAFPRLDDDDFSIGLQFTYVFGNDSAQSELEGVKLSIRELELIRRQEQDNYKATLQNILNSININKQVIKLREKDLKNLAVQHRVERKKYNQARLSLNFLIDTENRIASTKIGIIQLQTQLISLYFDYKNLTR